MTDFLDKKYSTPIGINGTKEEQEEFIKRCNEFAPIAEEIIVRSVFAPQE